jgi:NTP pyrophosphatase (non-canonical NTP hydrolase)
MSKAITSRQNRSNALLPACGFSEFEALVEKHSLSEDLLYNSNALAGESGEVANAVKKVHMATIKPEWVTQDENSLPTKEYFEESVGDELSDTLFYLVRLAKINGLTLQDLMQLQADKLSKQSIKYGRTFLK